ncbi:methyl-accepting chemotaxis protein [Mycoplasma mycoides subsp. mycoides]|uniref:Transmembrane protein n=2 Tax=Mycoplasma mycoides subsp. mycoides TaxID=2103 RepID=A0AAE2JSW2_MYCMY|nr:hypothetical protein [Mycoplasma mycoides]CAE76658.1 Hypothetical purine NTPase [Mycoplasma mycoides subsp. mycoides SC str. PG1]ADK70049.1 conserved domain protein [Mycoplasma mycoides subsp. mycoides SC str. Gladysdale]AIZ54838.1 hypothetical protein mycmycITA_00005 [Mycoplasma mycoides subsp. mycoides]AME10218.1 purine NTPase [Mycoplasma mycoides subsp. mycoides]AME11224.1 purine NTPase [Mycoplasma mycoides subsp. mycoides]
MIRDFNNQEVTLDDLEQKNIETNKNKPKVQFLMRFSLVFSNIFTHIFLLVLIVITSLFFGLRYTYYNYKVDLISNAHKIKPSIPKLKEVYKEALEVVEEIKRETDKNSNDSLINKIDEIKAIVKEVTKFANEFNDRSKKVEPKVKEVIEDGKQVTTNLNKITKEIEGLWKIGDSLTNRVRRSLNVFSALDSLANTANNDFRSVSESVTKITELAKKLSVEGEKITTNVEIIKKEVDYFSKKSEIPLKNIEKLKEIYRQKLPIFERNNKKLQEIWDKLMGIFNQFTVEKTESNYYNHLIYILLFLIIDSLALLVITYMSMISKTMKKILLFYIFGILSFNPFVWVSVVISFLSRPIKNRKRKFS